MDHRGSDLWQRQCIRVALLEDNPKQQPLSNQVAPGGARFGESSEGLFVAVNAMRIATIGLHICAFGLVAVLGDCAIQDKKTEQNVQTMHYTCATADGDLRTLENEKKTTLQRISAGVRSVVPITLVVGLVTGTAGTKYRIASGKYNEMIDAKIA